MKKAKFIFCAVCMAIILYFVLSWADIVLHLDDNRYSKANAFCQISCNEMTITEIDGEEVTVTDYKGDSWAFYGNGYEVGDRVYVYIRNRDNAVVDVREW